MGDFFYEQMGLLVTVHLCKMKSAVEARATSLYIVTACSLSRGVGLSDHGDDHFDFVAE